MNIQFFYTWHRRFGIIIAIVVLILTITGFALNHTEALKLDNRYISTEWMLDLYKIEVKGSILAFNVVGSAIVQLDDHLYFTDKEIRTGIKQLIGAVQSQEYIVVAVDQELILLDEYGEVIEIISALDGMPSGVRAIGTDTQQQIVIDTAYGIYQVDIDELNWLEASNNYEVIWSKPSVLDKELYQIIEEQYRGKGLTVERVMQDLHSGRILGKWGVFLVDVVGVLLMVLVFSGFYMWFRRFK